MNNEKRKVQTDWDLPLVGSKFNEMLASSTKESSEWRQVVTLSQLGLLLDNNASRTTVDLRVEVESQI